MRHFIKSIQIAGILITIGIALFSTRKIAHAEGEWYDEYDYALNTADQTIRLKKYRGSGGNITVPGSATIDGVTYQTVIAGEYGLSAFKSNESLTGIVFEPGVLVFEKCSAMFSGDKNLVSIVFPDDLDTSRATDMSYMFQNCSALESLDLSMFDTQSVTDFRSMFSYCTSLASIDVSSLDTSSAQRLSSMFEGCNQLETLDVSTFETAQVTDFSSMFQSCGNLKSINLTGFHTANAQRFNSMFQGCYNLETLDVRSFDTGNATTFANMFSSCQKLNTLDLSGFQTANVTTMEGMFSNCSSLSELNISSFNTEQVTSMKGMFTSMVAMQTLDVSSFNTVSVDNMYGMFSGVRNTNLNLSGFHTSNVTDMRNMFSNMTNLTSIDLSSFDMSNVTMSDNLLSSCTSLVEIKTPGIKPVISTRIIGTTKFAQKDAEGYYREEKYTDFLDAPSSTIIFRVDTYKIHFNANGGTGTMEDINAQCGMTLHLPLNTFVKDGYLFAGWSTTFAASTTVFEDGAEVIDLTRRNGTYNLYARWKRPVSFSVIVPASISQTVANGKYFNQTADIVVSFTGNTGDYLQITPALSMLSNGAGINIPTTCSMSVGKFYNGGGVSNIWIRSVDPMRDLPPGDYTGTLSLTFRTVYS